MQNKSRLAILTILPLALILTTVYALPLALAAPNGYVINANPRTLCANPGIDGRAAITVQSTGNFAGQVSLTYYIDNPAGANGPTLSSAPSAVTLRPGSAQTFQLGIHTTTTTETRLYYVYVYGTTNSGGFQQAIVEFNVNHNCSVGGNTVPINFAAVTSPLVILGASAAAIVGLVFAMSYMVKRRIQTAPTGLKLQ